MSDEKEHDRKVVRVDKGDNGKCMTSLLCFFIIIIIIITPFAAKIDTLLHHSANSTTRIKRVVLIFERMKVIVITTVS